MVDLIEVSAVVAAAGVLVGVVYYILDLRHQNKVRQTDLIMRLYSQVCAKEFMDAHLKNINLKVKDYSEFVKKYGTLTSEGPEHSALLMGWMFMEGIGVLLHRKLVDVDIIRELFPVENLWKESEPIITDYRKQSGHGSAYDWFEYLYNEVKKRNQQLSSKTG